MKVVGFKYFHKKKRVKNFKIFCIGGVFKTLFISMSVVLLVLLLNLITRNFFSYLETSVQNFVDSFVNVF